MRWYKEYYIVGRNLHITTFLIHLPFFSYFFWFFQGRGAYRAIQNFFYHQNKIPSFFKSCLIAIRYSLMSSLTSSLFFLVALALDYNYFGKAFHYVLQKFEAGFGEYLSQIVSNYLFGYLPSFLLSNNFEYGVLQGNLTVLWGSYMLFALCGACLSLLHAKSDIKRSLRS